MWLFRDMLHCTKWTSFSYKCYFIIIDKVASRAGWNGFVGRIWPAGRSLETPGIGLPYRKKQNSWQSQWLLFVTTNKRYTGFFLVFLQLPIHRKTISLSQNCYTTGYKQQNTKKVYFFFPSPDYIHMFQRI